jgi:acylphosphatase
MAAEPIARRFYVSGSVQGVGYRFFAERVAAQLDISGYVKNMFDGSVEVYAIGNTAQLDALKDQLERGPRMARVHGVEERDAEILAQYSNGFTIEHEY